MVCDVAAGGWRPVRSALFVVIPAPAGVQRRPVRSPGLGLDFAHVSVLQIPVSIRRLSE
jgi:hypothetical protein